MVFGQLETNARKVLKNQRVHILDSKGKTLCQTENMRRRKEMRLIHIDIPGKIKICGVCEMVLDESNCEPRLSVLMGERIP